MELTAVCTTRADSAEAARRAWGARLAFDDWRKMVASPEIEAVAVVVRVPSHYQPTKAALEAGKHVYCEWPLGRTTAEAVELTALAEARGLVTAIGLQARVNPAVMHLKELLEAGFVGEVMAVHVSLLRDGVLTRPPHRTWQRDAELGANTLTIANGHTVDAMRFVTGDFSRLKVSTRDLGDAVEVRIRDNGIGIPTEIRDKLFQPFFTTKPTGEGTGLGLSISWDIVTQQHGGTIAVDSRVGEFTEFTIRLPRT